MTIRRCEPVVKIEPYDASLGCLSIRLGRKLFAVINPAGKTLSLHDDEAEARNQAMFRNFTETGDSKCRSTPPR